MKIDIPLTDNDIDTDEPAESGKSVIGAMFGFLVLFGVVSAASYVFARIQSVTGVDTPDVPGV